MKKEKTAKIGGFSANSLVIPLAIVFALLHIAIISLVFEANRSNSELSDMMQNCSDYQQTATSLQAGSSTLSETASSFAQVPADEDGAMNVGPLLRYAQELVKDRRGPQVAAWFREQNVSAEIQGYIDAAAEEAEGMQETQLHVIALLRSLYPQPPLPELDAIPEVPLTEAETAMPEEARVAYARSLILSREYSISKGALAENIEKCHGALQREYIQASTKCQRHIVALRVALWAVIFAIIAIMLGTFLFFYRWLIMPLRSYARQITTDQSMDQNSRIREMRLLVHAYNALLRRHDRLESILRSAAETDALTNMPNRYSLEHYVLEIGEGGGAMAVLLFDVNYLKRTNDSEGHMAGDELLRKAGACIRECFATENGDNCFRIGGDEFAAVLRDCTEEAVRDRIDRFGLTLERENISVSVGYAFAANTDENSFGDLMKKADKWMYAHKKHTHEQERGAGEA